MKWIAEARSRRYSLSSRAVITPISFLKVVSLASQYEELCTVTFCVEPGAGNSGTAACTSCRRWTVGCHPYLDGTSTPKVWGFPWRYFVGHEQEGCQVYYPERGGCVFNGNTKRCLMQRPPAWPPALCRQWISPEGAPASCLITQAAWACILFGSSTVIFTTLQRWTVHHNLWCKGLITG